MPDRRCKECCVSTQQAMLRLEGREASSKSAGEAYCWYDKETEPGKLTGRGGRRQTEKRVSGDNQTEARNTHGAF